MNGRVEISTIEVAQLISNQFPHWASLQISKIENGGWDNHTFRLGDSLVIRLPSAEYYTSQVEREHRILPVLSRNISIPIPTPIAMGKPSDHYEWHWSILSWIDGHTANRSNVTNLSEFALEMADFLQQLQHCPKLDSLNPGSANFFRGGSMCEYTDQVQRLTKNLEGKIDTAKAEKIWQKAIDTEWQSAPVWVHGDLAPSNILVSRHKLKAVIDFGLCVMGDPACDLVIAWTFLDEKSRSIFRESIGLDENTWDRARGWALWKAMHIVDGQSKQQSSEIAALDVIEQLIKECG